MTPYPRNIKHPPPPPPVQVRFYDAHYITSFATHIDLATRISSQNCAYARRTSHQIVCTWSNAAASEKHSPTHPRLHPRPHPRPQPLTLVG